MMPFKKTPRTIFRCYLYLWSILTFDRTMGQSGVQLLIFSLLPSPVPRPTTRRTHWSLESSTNVHMLTSHNMLVFKLSRKHISILRKIYASTWDANLLSEDQRCIFAVASNEIYGGYGHVKFVDDFVNGLESHSVSFTEPGKYQARLNIYKEMVLSNRKGLQHPFHSTGDFSRFFDGCDNPSNYKNESEEISASCANEDCRNYSQTNLQTCSRCLVVCYCTRECQLAHFETHKKDCKAMAKLRKDKKAVAALAKDM